MKELLDTVAANRRGEQRGIYSVCTAHPLVLDAACYQAKKDNSSLLVEATANQVNQYGGYTGMKPEDFRPFLENISQQAGLPVDRLILGGDHLGPVCWVDETADAAMQKAHVLIEQYVEAGFKKIHLDTSMPCSDDPNTLTDEVIAARAASLCATAERTAIQSTGTSDLVYVVGTEVPPPGGATEAISTLDVTPVPAVQETITAHRSAFIDLGLDQAWERVVGLVVQPGVEFDHLSVHDFEPEKAKKLSDFVETVPNLVFEAHSTDYQPIAAYPQLVAGHFAILKVGPQLTFALREALFALSHIEDELIRPGESSRLRQICENDMLEFPKYWEKYYSTTESTDTLLRRYSYSDRIRYYWNRPSISKAVDRLFENLSRNEIPPPLLAMYLPRQYQAVRAGRISSRPQSLVRDHILEITEAYAAACRPTKEQEN